MVEANQENMLNLLDRRLLKLVQRLFSIPQVPRVEQVAGAVASVVLGDA